MGPDGFEPSTSRLSGDYELSQIPTINRSFATEHDNLLVG